MNDLTQDDLQRILNMISPSVMNRTEWVKVGMALKYEGCPFDMFDRWSAGDSRPGQYAGSEVTLKTWESFHNTGSGTVTAGTLIQMARDQGFDPFPKISNNFLDWEDEIDIDDGETAEQHYERPNFRYGKKACFEIADYLEACFLPDDNVNVVSGSFQDDDGKYKPIGLGLISDTAEEYCKAIRKKADKPDCIEEVLGAYNHNAGVWIRVNPISPTLQEGQKGISDRNVTRFENALIECDEHSPSEQLRLIKELRLPYKALVWSGGKSVHAIIGVQAESLADYKEKVTWLQQYCISHGLPVDTQNKNASRLTRLPGVERGHDKQVLIETAKSEPFEDFRRRATAEEDAQKLEMESFADIFADLPDKAPELIEGVLREGHKMLISGPSKAGKSFALISLAIAIAESKEWMGYHCQPGRVLYVNLEIDRASFYHRMADVYKAHGWQINHPDRIDVLNLRGMAEPLDSLGPKLQALTKVTKYQMVIIDPIYKVITGDENSASDMGRFCNLFDEIAKAGQTAIAYCHHHSKGSQAQKSAIDRASGSGVFARDPDAIIDMTEIGFTAGDRQEFAERLLEAVDDAFLKETGQYQNLTRTKPEVLSDRFQKQELVLEHLDTFPDKPRQKQYEQDREKAEELSRMPCYRISMTLREFKSPEDRSVIFSYPIHVEDKTGYLSRLCLAGDNSLETMNKKKAEKAKKRADEKREWFDMQHDAGKEVSITDMSEQFGVSLNTIRNWVGKQSDLKRENGLILYKDEAAPDRGKGRSGCTEKEE